MNSLHEHVSVQKFVKLTCIHHSNVQWICYWVTCSSNISSFWNNRKSQDHPTAIWNGFISLESILQVFDLLWGQSSWYRYHVDHIVDIVDPRARDDCSKEWLVDHCSNDGRLPLSWFIFLSLTLNSTMNLRCTCTLLTQFCTGIYSKLEMYE